MRTKTQQELIDIIRFEIRGIPLPEGFSVSDEEALINITRKHDLTHLVYDALTKNGLPCCSQFAMQQYYASIWRAEQMAHELSSMTELFESEGIDFIPLKGAVIRPLYPEPWMRTSADIDMLFRKEDFDCAKDLAVERLGYTEDKEDQSPHHISLHVPGSGVHIELHHDLFADYHTSSAVREQMPEIWAQARAEEGFAHLLRMSDACFYYYHIAHMVKHLSLTGGCPVRGLIDLWILDNLPQRDEEGRRQLIEKAGLSTFTGQMSALAKAWMEDGPVPSEELEQYILSGDMYGNLNSKAAIGVNESSAGGFILKRIFLPYDVLKYAYPALQKHKFLLPVFQVVRWTKVFRSKYRKRLKNQAEALARTSRGEVAQIHQVNQILGIENFNKPSTK